MSFKDAMKGDKLSIEDYAELHAKAKVLVKDYLTKATNLNVEYGSKVDLIISGSTKVTVQIQPTWREYDYPFKVVHISKKNNRLLDGNTIFCVVNVFLTRVMLIMSSVIKDAPTNEFNYQVPLDKVNIYNF